jgi:hypothetical protein
MISDVEAKSHRTTYCFSDGLGKLSAELAREVAAEVWFHLHFRFDMVGLKVLLLLIQHH